MPAPDGRFSVFLSYSTDPDYHLAQQVESFLERFHERHLPLGVQLEPIVVCRDGSDFSTEALRQSSGPAGDDVIEALIRGYLERCDHLLVLCSERAPLQRYVSFEIETFLESHPADRVLLAVTEGTDPAAAPERVFPRAALERGLHQRPYYDLREARGPDTRAWRKVRDLEEELANIAAHLHRATSGELLPRWHREVLRRSAVARQLLLEVDEKLQIPGLETLREQLLAYLGEVQDELALRDDRQGVTAHMRIATHMKRSEVELRAGRPEVALEELHLAAGLIQQGLAEHPGSVHLARDEWMCHIMLADISAARLDYADAESKLRAALDATERHLSAMPESNVVRADRAPAFGKLGEVNLARSRFDEARDDFARSIELSRAVLNVEPANAEAALHLGVALGRLALVQMARKDFEASLAAWSEALAAAQKIGHLDSMTPRVGLELSRHFIRSGDEALAARDFPAAGRAFEVALVSIMRPLAWLARDNRDLRWEMCRAYERNGELALAQGHLALAREIFESVRVALSDLTSSASAPDYRRDYGVVHVKLAELAQAEGDLARARADLESACRIYRVLLQAGEPSAARDLEQAEAALARLISA